MATYSNATKADVQAAIDSALAARKSWADTPFAERASIFLKAADLIATKYRYDIMALTMHGQGKNACRLRSTPPLSLLTSSDSA